MSVQIEVLEQRTLLSFSTFDVPPAAAASGVSAQLYTPHIAAGPNDAIWASDPIQSRVVRVDPDGTIKNFNLASGSAPTCLAATEDGSLWYGDVGKHEIGEITPSGAIKEYGIPRSGRYSFTPVAMTIGPDRNVWFIATYQQTGNWYGFGTGPYVQDHPIVARINAAGRVKEFRLAPVFYNVPNSIVSFDRKLYVVNQGQLISIKPSGHLTTFRGDALALFGANLLVRPEGKLGGPGFTITLDRRSERITWTVTYDPKVPVEIGRGADGPEGNIWFVNSNWSSNLPESIGFVGPDGTITLLAVPDNDKITDIVSGGDGNLWMVNADVTKVYRLKLDSATLSTGIT